MKSSVFNLVFTVFLLWLTIQIEIDYEIYLAYFLVVTVGIIHGANDISLISFVTKDSSKSTKRFLLFYLALIVLASVTFFKFPLLALIIFIIVSCYHFGEQHFYSQLEPNAVKPYLLYLGYGALIFGLLFFFNNTETTTIIFELTGLMMSKDYYLILLVFGGVVSLVMSFLNFKFFKEGFNYFQELFLLLLFALTFKIASLIWAFSIYFIIWHSIPSLKDQTLVLYGAFDKKTVGAYVKSSFFNWFISILGLAIVYYISTLLDIRFITLFFAFLAAITIPHVIVMYYLNKN